MTRDFPPTGTRAGARSSHGIAPQPEACQALVLSGGGALGAYEVGVMRALMSGASPVSDFRPLEFTAYSGSSVGAYNAAFMVSQRPTLGDRTIDVLETVWRERIANTPTSCGNGVFRIRGAPFQFLDPGCLLRPFHNALELAKDSGPIAAAFLGQGARFLASDESIQVKLLQTVDVSAFISVSPLRELVAETIDPARLAAAPERVAVVASNWRTGRPKLFENRGPNDPISRQSILASMALPGLFPPVFLEGVPFVDGAVTVNTPLKPAIAGGADVLHVVYVDPLVEDVPFPMLPTTLDAFYRLYLILVSQRVNTDIGTAALINVLIEEDGVTVLEVATQLPSHQPGGESRSEQRVGGSDKPYRPIEIHKYRPQHAPSNAAALVDFQLAAIDSSMAEGFEDASRHDCGAQGCILVDPAEWKQAPRRAGLAGARR